MRRQALVAYPKIEIIQSSLVVQQVKDLVLSLLWLRPLLWHGFIPWPRIFCTPQVQPKKKKRKKRKKRKIW